MRDPVEDYIDEWMDVFQRVVRKRNGLFRDKPLDYSADALLATFTKITRDIIGPYVYWFERHDAAYMEGSDVEALAESTAGGTTLDSPPSSEGMANPPPDFIPVSVTGTAPKTIAAKEDLKKYGLIWDGQAWAGNIKKEHLLGLKKFCDNAGIVLHRG